MLISVLYAKEAEYLDHVFLALQVHQTDLLEVFGFVWMFPRSCLCCGWGFIWLNLC